MATKPRKPRKPKKQASPPKDHSQPHPDMPGHYHGEMVCKVLNLTIRRLQQLAKAGDLPSGKPGGYYPLLETVNRYCKYLQERSRGRPASETTEQTQRIQGERERKLKMDNDFRSGKLILLADVEQMAMEIAVAVSNSLDGVAGRIAGGDAVMRQRIFNEHRRIRETIGTRLENLAHPVTDGEVGDATPTPLSLAVGGSETDTAEG